MCGIAGILNGATRRNFSLDESIRRMTAAVAHRGPDDCGIWTDREAGVALGFRRLAILDLSIHGHQPMQSPSGRYSMVFNGEVYNYKSIRSELGKARFTFRGHSDTEVILAAIENWGVAAAVPRFVGMFAIAVWDGMQRRLWLIRDRLGIKPLFYYHRDGLLTFGSELKVLSAGPEFDPAVDRDSLHEYVRYLYVPAPASIYEGVRKLAPGHLLAIDDVSNPLPESQAYWPLENIARHAVSSRHEMNETDAVDQLDHLLSESVSIRMQADVPLGALLSGGIDSSTVVALMQENSPRRVKTFSIGFMEEEHDEARHARRIAQHLGTEHTELRVSGAEALEVVPRLPELFDEPLADPSQIPTYLVCALARREVVVALSGDGGDEVFSGYYRYIHGEPLIGRLSRIPRPVRRLAAAGVMGVSSRSWDGAYRMVASIFPRSMRHRLAGEKAHKLARLMRWDSETDMYNSLLGVWPNGDEILRSTKNGPSRIESLLNGSRDLKLLDRMMLADQATYLPDDLLAKVDRASMAVALEVRVPLLDHRVLEFAWRTPSHLRIRDGKGKWLLRQVLYRRVPALLVDRPKVGFTVPISAWLRGPLRAWADDLLTTRSFEQSDFFRAGAVQRAWRRFLSGEDSIALGIWAILVFQTWESRWRKRP